MELCTVQAVSRPCPSQKLLFPNPNPKTSSSSSKPYFLSLGRRPSHSALAVHSRSLNSRSFVARASESDGASSGGSYGGVNRDSVATFEDISPAVDTESPKVEKESPEGEKESPAVVYEQTSEPEEAVKVDPLLTADEEQTPIFEFLEKLNIDTSDPYTLALYGGSTLFVLWLSSAVVGAIDAIPVFPKLMELVGLGYTCWFTYRYLIFKSKREELFAKIEDLKEEIIG